MIRWYETTIADTGRAPAFWMLVALLVAFAVVRLITRLIRRGARGLGDVSVGGVHIHHQVWGILLLLVCGALGIVYQPESPWMEVLAAGFGVGAALTLDEFSLWFYLEDNYWTVKGRASIDAVLVALLIGVVLLLGVLPYELGTESRSLGRAGAGLLIALGTLLAVVAALKGKPFVAVIGIVVLPVALVGAVRLAHPESPWATVAYRGPRAGRMRRAEERFGPRWQARRDRWLDLIGGTPGTSGRPAAPDAGPPAAGGA